MEVSRAKKQVKLNSFNGLFPVLLNSVGFLIFDLLLFSFHTLGCLPHFKFSIYHSAEQRRKQLGKTVGLFARNLIHFNESSQWINIITKVRKYYLQTQLDREQRSAF